MSKNNYRVVLPFEYKNYEIDSYYIREGSVTGKSLYKADI